MKRLSSLRKSIKFQAKNQSQVKLEEKIDKEVQLLKRVREINASSFHIRVKTGGSLMDFQKFNKFSDPNEFLKQNNNQFLNETKNDENSNIHKFERFNDYFKHNPKYPLKVQPNQSHKNSARNYIQNYKTDLHQIPSKQITKQNSPRKKNENKLKNEDSTKTILNLQNLRLRSAQDQNQLKKEELRNFLIVLPIVLAENFNDKNTLDFAFFKGTNLIHRHEYRKAIEVFTDYGNPFIEEHQKKKDMI